MKIVIFCFIIIIHTQTITGQTPFEIDYPLAPEIWSEPVKIDSFSHPYYIFESPTLNETMDTIYFGAGSGIFRSILVNGIWQKPEKINVLNHTYAATRHPSLSRDGKRIYHTAWGGYGNWDLYVNQWNDTTKTWGPPQNLGAEINTSSIEYFAYEVSKDTLYCVVDVEATLGPAKFIRNKLTNKWEYSVDFAEDHPLNAGKLSGLCLTTDKRKMYFSQWIPLWPNYKEKGTELCVVYWDTAKKAWGDTYFLNINSKGIPLDSNWNNTLGGWDGNPWVSSDGKVLFFSSSRNINFKDSSNTHDIYISYLLVDEHGDSVISVRNGKNIIFDFRLNQNYPNPFNPSTTINFDIYEEGYIKLIVYDSLGKKIVDLINERKKKGNYSIEFNPQLYGLSSGTYFYQLMHNGTYIVKKMQYVK